MKFGKRYSNVTVFMAMLHGVIIGVAAVALIGFILAGTNGKQNAEKPEKVVPTSGPEPVEIPSSTAVEPLQLFARQHGVFSTASSAAATIAADPSLMTAAVVNVGDQYFVWSAVGLSEAEIMDSEEEGTYRKSFVADASTCQVVGSGKIVDVLTSTETSKIKISNSENDDENTKIFNKDIAAITAFSNDMRVIRLHLLSYYSYKKDCVKISF